MPSMSAGCHYRLSFSPSFEGDTEDNSAGDKKAFVKQQTGLSGTDAVTPNSLATTSNETATNKDETMMLICVTMGHRIHLIGSLSFN